VIRAATVDDAAGVAAVCAAARPHQVRTAAGVRWELEHPPGEGEAQRWVEVDGAGLVRATATLRLDAATPPGARLSIAVHPANTGRGIGTGLLDLARRTAQAAGAPTLRSIAEGDPRSLSFAEAHGWVVQRSHTVSGLDPDDAPPPEPVPAGLLLVSCADLVDPDAVRATHNAVAADDPSGLSEPMSAEQFHRTWWDPPDHKPALGAALLADAEVVAFTSLAADLDRGVAWTGMTATRSDHRGQGLALLVKAASLRAAAASGVTLAATANDDANAAMLAVNRRLGYAPIATAWSLELPL
jgi:GNAT superfamily N-acetyltransferase